MGDITTTVASVTTMLTATAGSVLTLITNQPILMIGVGLLVLGSAVAFVKKIKR